MPNLTFKRNTKSVLDSTPLTENMVFFTLNNNNTFDIYMDYKNNGNIIERHKINGLTDDDVYNSTQVNNNLTLKSSITQNKTSLKTYVGCGLCKDVIGDLSLINYNTLTSVIKSMGQQNTQIYANWSATSYDATVWSLGRTCQFYLLYYKGMDATYYLNNNNYNYINCYGTYTKVFTGNTTYFLRGKYHDDSTYRYYQRKVSINGNTLQITFGDCYEMTSLYSDYKYSDGEKVIDNTKLVPLALYGFEV